MPEQGEHSFEALAVPHLETVYRVARRMTRNDHEAEDLVQETYLKAYKAFARFEVREFGIKPWLLKILYNSFLNRQARLKKAPRATDQQTLDQVHADGDYSGPPDLDYEHLDQEVKLAIDQLPDEFPGQVGRGTAAARRSHSAFGWCDYGGGGSARVGRACQWLARSWCGRRGGTTGSGGDGR